MDQVIVVADLPKGQGHNKMILSIDSQSANDFMSLPTT
jgi:hypothetical protein